MSPIVIAVGLLIDGKGHVIHDTRVVIENGKIARLHPKAPVNPDLRHLSLMPGLTDPHVHINWSFGKDGKNQTSAEATADDAYRTAANAYATLMAGFTTIQSMGSPAGG